MHTPTDSEVKALREADVLLRFASERVNGLDPALSLAIAQAVEAQETGTWTPEVSQRFWSAFGALCDQIKPVTMECLQASLEPLDYTSRLPFLRRRRRTLAEQTSGRYLLLLYALLCLATPTQLYIWLATSMSRDVDQSVKELSTQSTRLSAETGTLQAELAQEWAAGTPNEKVWTADRYGKSEQVKQDSKSLMNIAARLNEQTLNLGRLVRLAPPPDISADLAFPPDIQPGDEYSKQPPAAMAAALKVETRARAPIERAGLMSGVFLSFVLPILFGTIGAVAFVVRTISEQIRNATFSHSSPIRHSMRVTLGALMGVVIGLFTGLSDQLSLPPLAMAFLAGYGVEAVFSMFDSTIERFRQPSPPATGR